MQRRRPVNSIRTQTDPNTRSMAVQTAIRDEIELTPVKRPNTTSNQRRTLNRKMARAAKKAAAEHQLHGAAAAPPATHHGHGHAAHSNPAVDDLLQLDIHGALEHPLLQYKLHGAKAAPQKTAPQPVAPAPAKRFQCTWCGKCSASSSDLERHVRVHTGEKPFQCNQCDAKFSDQGDLVKHSSRHDSSLPHVCSLCKWRFATAHGLSKHCSYAHGVKLDSVPNHFECEWCSKCFASNTKLEEHKRVHAADKPFECKTCDAKFPNRGHLMKHMSRHDRSLPHVCSLCQWRFSTPKGLGAHISQAHGMKPDKMDQKVRPTREDHKINDSDPSQVQSPAKKPFRCSICGQRFPSRNAKWSHMGRHNSHLPHVCNQCGCGYDTQYGLNMHVAKFCSVFKA